MDCDNMHSGCIVNCCKAKDDKCPYGWGAVHKQQEKEQPKKKLPWWFRRKDN